MFNPLNLSSLCQVQLVNSLTEFDLETETLVLSLGSPLWPSPNCCSSFSPGPRQVDCSSWPLPQVFHLCSIHVDNCYNFRINSGVGVFYYQLSAYCLHAVSSLVDYIIVYSKWIRINVGEIDCRHKNDANQIAFALGFHHMPSIL